MEYKRKIGGEKRAIKEEYFHKDIAFSAQIRKILIKNQDSLS